MMLRHSYVIFAAVVTLFAISCSVCLSYEIRPIEGGELVSALSSGGGSWQYFSVDVPEGEIMDSVELQFRSGDASLFASHGRLPSVDDKTCRLEQHGQMHICQIDRQESGRWFIGIYSDNGYEKGQIQAWTRMPEPHTISLNETVLLTTDGQTNHHFFRILVPPERETLDIKLLGISDAVELFIKYGEAPSLRNQYEIKVNENTYSCSISNPRAGYWYLRIRTPGQLETGSIQASYTPDTFYDFSLDSRPTLPVHHGQEELLQESVVETVRKPVVYAEAESWVNLNEIAKLSSEPIYVRVIGETGTVSSIQGTFHGDDPIEIFEKVLIAGGLRTTPGEWEVAGTGVHDDQSLTATSLRRRNVQGLLLAGGTVTLVYDEKAVYAIEGRLAGEIPEVELGPVDKEEWIERMPSYSVDGPYVYMPQVLWFPDVKLANRAIAIYTLIGPEGTKFADSFGNVLYEAFISDDSELAEFRHYYENFVLSQAPDWQSCSDKAIKVLWKTPTLKYFQAYLKNMTGHLRIYKDSQNLIEKAWPTSYWINLQRTMASMDQGCGSRYAKEPKVIWSNPTVATYKEKNAVDIWMESVALRFWFEAKYKPAWSIKSLSSKGRNTLLDMGVTFFSNYNRKYNTCLATYNSTHTGGGLGYRPFAEYLWLKGKKLIDLKSARNSATNLADYFRKHFKHAHSLEKYDHGKRNRAGYSWGRRYYPENLKALNYRATGQEVPPGEPENLSQKDFHLSYGCWHTTAMICVLLRNINIPCLNEPEKITLAGAEWKKTSPKPAYWKDESWQKHSRLVLVDLNLSLLHSDDLYMGNYLQMQKNDGHLSPGAHKRPEKQNFLVTKNDIFDPAIDLTKLLQRKYARSKYCHLVFWRDLNPDGSWRWQSASGCNTKNEEIKRALRRWKFSRRGFKVGYQLLEPFRNMDLLGFTLSDKEWRVCKMYPQGQKPPQCKDGITEWWGDESPDFFWWERETFHCAGLSIVKKHGYTTICEKEPQGWGLGNKPICKWYRQGKDILKRPGPASVCRSL